MARLRNISYLCKSLFSKAVPSCISRLKARHLEQFFVFQKHQAGLTHPPVASPALHRTAFGAVLACYTQGMSLLSSDTHPKIESLQVQFWRQASPTQKMKMLAQLNASARTVALAGLRSRYPQANQAELRRRLAGLLLGEELARKVYGELDHAK